MIKGFNGDFYYILKPLGNDLKSAKSDAGNHGKRDENQHNKPCINNSFCYPDLNNCYIENQMIVYI